ncbi:L,D-transpeptidase family protein [Pontibacter sp. CAU 1760]
MARLLFICLIYLAAGAVCAQESRKAPYDRENMLQAIAHYQQLADTGKWHFLPDDIFLRPGDSSRYLLQVQENLVLTGDLPVSSFSGSTATYTSAVTTAIKRFQQRHGLVPDGVLGPNTVAALNVPPAERLRQLQRNFNRLDTLLAHVPLPYVIINIPDYTLQVVDNDTVLLHMRVIVGKPQLPTIPIRSKLTTVVLHPYWFLPTSISADEIVPLLRRNPGYLDKKNMKLEKQYAGRWVQINPWRVDWHKINRSNFEYRIVQMEGPDNELGTVKFPFPNAIPQYLHDTPKKEMFTYPTRAFSHGCIRLEKPVELANLLLEKGSGYSEEKIERLWMRRKANHYLNVHKPPPLLVVYLTAWADADRLIQFRDDVYGYDLLPHLTKE